jgi:hypothetical protein
VRCLVAIAAGLAFATPAFAQQTGDLARTLAKGASCASPASAKADLQEKINAVGAAPGDLIAGLNAVNADSAACQPVRDAAKDIATAIAAAVPATEDERIAAASRAVVDAALAEAEQRVASLRFEVGRPPRNMTQARDLVPRP